MKYLTLLFLVGTVIPASNGQITIPVTSLPSNLGEYNEYYVRTNSDLSTFMGSPGSNYWDFSQAQAANDSIGRMDIVPTSDSGDTADFPGATFVEKFTGGLIQGTSWEYYATTSTNGLVFYGTYYPVGYGADPAVPITPPAMQLPPTLYYGETWNTQYSYTVVDPLFGDVPVDYQANAVVDAYGTMNLPGIGKVPVLRVALTENTYEFSTLFLTDTDWTWYAPGLGYVAQAVSYDQSTIAASSQPYTNGLARAFLAAPLKPSPASALKISSGNAVLTWSSISGASGYVVEISTNLSSGSWSPWAELTNTSLGISLTAGTRQEFFKVVAQP